MPADPDSCGPAAIAGLRLARALGDERMLDAAIERVAEALEVLETTWLAAEADLAQATESLPHG